jgi:hypothetical protein
MNKSGPPIISVTGSKKLKKKKIGISFSVQRQFNFLGRPQL